MAAAFAHEIKTPAALAMAYVGLMRSLSPEAAEYCNHIQDALYDISELVQAFLQEYELSQSANGSAGIRATASIDITTMLCDMINDYKRAMPHISCYHMVDNQLTCYANEMHVRLIFSNLLKNAVEAVGADGHITLYATQSGGYLHTAIHNTNLPDTSTHDKPLGNGIGLSICYWLTEQLNGQLKYESSENGCVVIVSLPQAG